MPWIGLAALVSGYVLAFVVRYGTAVILPDLRTDFGADEAALGALGAAYFWPYALIQPVAGVLSDWWGPRRSVTLFLIGAGLGTILFAVAPIYPVAIVGRALGGAGVAIVFVCGISAVGQWFRPQHFGTVSGLYAASGTMGGLLAARPLDALVDLVGWRGAFGIIAGVLLATALVAFLAIPERTSASGASGTAPARPANPWAGVRQALGLRNLWLTGVYTFVALGILSSMQGLWTVPFLTDVYRLDERQAAGVLEGWSYGLLVGIPVWGWLADRVTRTRKWTIVLSIVLHAALWALLIVAPGAVPPAALFALFVFAGFTDGCWMPAYAQVRATSPAAIAGTALGLLNFAFFAGAAVYQQLTGILLAQFAQPGGPLPVEAYQALFGLFLASLVVAALAVAASRDAPADATRLEEAQPTTPATTLTTTPAQPTPDWPAWIAARRQDEADLARGFELWSHQTRLGELAEVLEIAAARARDRAFLLRRAGAADPSVDQPWPGAVVAARWPESGSDLDRLDQLPPLLARYSNPAVAPSGEREQELVRHLQRSERETLDLLEEQRQRLLALSQREAVRVLPGQPAQQLGNGRVYWKELSPADSGRPTIVRVAQRPGTIVRLVPGGGARILVALDGRGLLRLGDRATGETGEAVLSGQIFEIGAEAAVELSVADDLLLSYLLIATGPLAPTAAYPAASDDAGLASGEATVLVQVAPNGTGQAETRAGTGAG